MKAGDALKAKQGKTWFAVAEQETTVYTLDDDGNAVIAADGVYSFYLNGDGVLYIVKEAGGSEG